MIMIFFSRNQSSFKYLAISLVLSVTLYDCALAMQPEDLKREESTTSSLFAPMTWLSSSVQAIYKLTRRNGEKPENTLGFIHLPLQTTLSGLFTRFSETDEEPLPPLEKGALPLLEKVLKGTAPVTANIGNVRLADQVLTYGTAPTLAYFIEQGAKFPGSCLADLAGMRFSRLQGIEKLRLLIKAGYDVNFCDSEHYTPLYMAFFYSDISDNGIHFDYACAYSEILLNAGANPNHSREDMSDTPFSELLGNIVLWLISTPAHRDKESLIVKAFLACGADYRRLYNKHQCDLSEGKPHIISVINNFPKDKTALFAAIDQCDFEQIKQLARRLPFKITDAHGNTPLHYAVLRLVGKSNDLRTLDEDAEKAKLIIRLILRILPQLASLKNNKGSTPIDLIFPPSKFWLLNHCFIPAAYGPQEIQK